MTKSMTMSLHPPTRAYCTLFVPDYTRILQI